MRRTLFWGTQRRQQVAHQREVAARFVAKARDKAVAGVNVLEVYAFVVMLRIWHFLEFPLSRVLICRCQPKGRHLECHELLLVDLTSGLLLRPRQISWALLSRDFQAVGKGSLLL